MAKTAGKSRRTRARAQERHLVRQTKHSALQFGGTHRVGNVTFTRKKVMSEIQKLLDSGSGSIESALRKLREILPGYDWEAPCVPCVYDCSYVVQSADFIWYAENANFHGLVTAFRKKQDVAEGDARTDLPLSVFHEVRGRSIPRELGEALKQPFRRGDLVSPVSIPVEPSPWWKYLTKETLRDETPRRVERVFYGWDSQWMISLEEVKGFFFAKDFCMAE